jgi:AmmeMemoRadiSam system protein B
LPNNRRLVSYRRRRAADPSAKRAARSLTGSVRMPVAASLFYPERKETLASSLRRFIPKSVSGKTNAIGMVIPHGSWNGCGPWLGKLFSSLKWPARVVILGPAHERMATSGCFIQTKGQWQLPGGTLQIDEPLAQAILKKDPELAADPEFLIDEYAHELPLPFLQKIGKLKRFVPLVVNTLDGAAIGRLAQALTNAAQQFPDEKIYWIATTQVGSYRPTETARQQLALAMDRIRAMDSEGLIEAVFNRKIEMCGAGAVAAVLQASRLCGARVSGEIPSQVIGNPNAAVGMISVLFEEGQKR